MSNKRAKAKEFRRKQKQRKKVMNISLITAAVVIAAALGLYGWDRFTKSYVMVYEGNRISVGDYRFMQMNYAGPDVEDPQAETLDKLFESIIIVDRAKADGIALTENEKEQSRSWAESYKSMYAQLNMDMSFISTERLAEILSVEHYFTHLMEKHMGDLPIDEDELNIAFAEYKENEKADYYELSFKYAVAEYQDELEAAITEAKAGGMTFDQVIEQYSIDYNEDSGIITAGISNLQQFGLDEDRFNQVLEMEAGEISEVFDIDGYYLALEIESKNIPEDEEILEPFRENFIRNAQAEGLRALIEDWKAQATYTVNQRAIDAIS